MSLLTLCLAFGLHITQATSSQVPSKASSSTLIGDHVVVLCLMAVFGTISLIGACAFCFRRKKTFEKLENEATSPENVKKNEYPIFRALSSEGGSESAAIVPGDLNNLSRDNLLNSSDNLTAEDGGSSPRSDVADSDVVLIEKISTSPSIRDKSQPTSSAMITYESEKNENNKKMQSPSSSTPLLYANNVQSYQHSQPVTEQVQQKAATVMLASESPFKFYKESKDELITCDIKQDFMTVNIAEESQRDEQDGSSMNTNPFFKSLSMSTVIDDQSTRDLGKDETSEVESSLNDNSEKYETLEDETDADDLLPKADNGEDEPAMFHRQNSKSSNGSGDNNSIEEALRVLDNAIGLEYDSDDFVMTTDESKETVNLEEIKEEATFLVDSIVNDCEKMIEQRWDEEHAIEKLSNDFSTLGNQNMSTPCAPVKSKSVSPPEIDAVRALFPEGIDISGINDETFPVAPVNNETFNKTTPELPAIRVDSDEMGSGDLTTVTPVNTPIELSYTSETWDKMSYSTGAISKQQTEMLDKTVTLETDGDCGPITFNRDGWYLHPQTKNDTFEVCGEDDDDDGNNMEDMSTTFDQLRRQLTEMLPHAQGMSQHNDFLDDEMNKDSNSPSETYGIKYGDLDEATNAGTFDLFGALINPEPAASSANEMHINYKRPLSPIMEESEYDETCRTFVFNNDTKMLDSTSTGLMESVSAEMAVMGMPKTLMASNDTLFNFEDTLSDPNDNLMSPRMNTAGSSTSSTLSRQESQGNLSNERTPTNEEPPKLISDIFNKNQELDVILRNNIRQHPLNLDLNSPVASTSKYEITIVKLAHDDGSWPLELPEAQQIINDLSSPEQNKTGDSLSYEQDVTFTIDDQKTCVSLVLKNDDERISEISEPNFASDSFDMVLDDDSMLGADDNFNFETNDENGNQDCDTKEMELSLDVKETSSAIFDNDSINPAAAGDGVKDFEADSLEPDVKILADNNDADSMPTSQMTKSVYSNDSINAEANSKEVQNLVDVKTTHQNQMSPPSNSEDVDTNDKKKSCHIIDGDDPVLHKGADLTIRELHMANLTTFSDFLLHEMFHGDSGSPCGTFNYGHNYYYLSSEADPWGSTTDIRQVSCNPDMMTTSFTNEWTDDDDSSHSSEEFMYVKGNASDSNGVKSEILKEQQEAQDIKEQASDDKTSDDVEDIQIVDLEAEEGATGTWIHEDKFPATPMFHGDEPQITEESGDESAEEGEFIPSYWDQSLQPTRSSLKSPEKEQERKREQKKRRVNFKIQRYHSVYEYPCEVVQLSPAYSEPKLWSNYMDDCSGTIDYFTYAHHFTDLQNDFDQPMDGFNISSTSRPFHSNHLSTHLHNTWPNECTEFSWSQIQDITDKDECKKQQHIEHSLKIEWPIRKHVGFDDDDSDERPDSGVGESDILTDSPSMGELCHTKNSLRLPLEMISSTSSEVSDFLSDRGSTAKDNDHVTIEITTDDDILKPFDIHEHDDVSEKLLNDLQFSSTIIPTPSCTGSMDSLSSSSASTNSERGPISFTTFGKTNVISQKAISKDDNGKTAIIFIEDVVDKNLIESKTIIHSTEKNIVGSTEKYMKDHKLAVGSSDEDSGFENFSRLAKIA